MGLPIITAGAGDSSHPHTQKLFILSNYTLLGAASSCIFLTLSLRLLPSLTGTLLILLHVITIAGAVSGLAAVSRPLSSSASRLYGAHMVATVVTAVFQGSVSVLTLTRPEDLLGRLRSYVREEEGVSILRLAGGLCAAMFCLEWVVLTAAFFLNYYAYVERNGNGIGSAKVGDVDLEYARS